MNNQEYERKKRKCWVEFCKDNGIDQEANISIFDAFNQIFDRAYALCKHEKEAESSSLWERLIDDEKREMQCRYHTNECVLRDHKKRTGDKAQSKAVARMKLLENLFGKHNLKCNE